MRRLLIGLTIVLLITLSAAIGLVIADWPRYGRMLVR